MFAALALALIVSAPPAQKAESLPVPVGQGCSDGCHCVFPGQCGHPGCDCLPTGYRPPATGAAAVDIWVPFAANPEYEIYGHMEGKVFRYSASRKLASAKAIAVVMCKTCGTWQTEFYLNQRCTKCGMMLPPLVTGKAPGKKAAARAPKFVPPILPDMIPVDPPK